MALQAPISLDSGIDLPTSYARIIEFNGDKSSLSIFVSWYASQAARDAQKPSVKDKRFHIEETPEGDLLPWLYGWLKGQPEFAGAEDV